jgi:hypothetical protein
LNTRLTIQVDLGPIGVLEPELQKMEDRCKSYINRKSAEEGNHQVVDRYGRALIEQPSPTPMPRSQVPRKRKGSAYGETGRIEAQDAGEQSTDVGKEAGEWESVDDEIEVWAPKKRTRKA